MGTEEVRLLEAGKEYGRAEASSANIVLRGEGGAYISDNCDNSGGDVNADNNWRTLSHWVWAVEREEWIATRIEDRGDEGFEDPYEPLWMALSEGEVF